MLYALAVVLLLGWLSGLYALCGYTVGMDPFWFLKKKVFLRLHSQDFMCSRVYENEEGLYTYLFPHTQIFKVFLYDDGILEPEELHCDGIVEAWQYSKPDKKLIRKL